MKLIISLRRKTTVFLSFSIALVLLCTGFFFLFFEHAVKEEYVASTDDWYPVLEALFAKKNSCLLSGQCDKLKSIYASGESNSNWAIALETRRANYLQNWAKKQGIMFKSIVSHFYVKTVKKVGRGYSLFTVVSTEYHYSYLSMPEADNMFRIGTYHTIDLISGNADNHWLISLEWYLDPFYASLNLQTSNTEEIRSYIDSQPYKERKDLSEQRKRAVEYANRYSGAAADDEYGYSYNSKYPNFNLLGGDCTNYVSQALFESGGFKRTKSWTFVSNAASRAWCNAQGFKDFMISSGRATILAQGTYSQVYKSAYKLLPGDIISYVENGLVTHSAIVTGYDTKGYPLVNTHTTDRLRVPWDMGWNDSNIKFYLLHVNY